MSELYQSDKAVVGRMLGSDEAAFDHFFDTYFSRLYRFAVTRLDNDADAAEEVVQATLCKAIAKLATYRGEAALFTWLCTFCRHEIS
ncbi:MAG: polymerase sigma-70 factor, subfamily, partial [Acidobacteria bacterium]|nr:polymerase sigma-70 factor, subfamily [Acidobacteriota bacterium]